MQDAGSTDLFQNASHDKFLQKFKNCLDNRQYLVQKRLRAGDCCLTEVQIAGIVRQLLLPVTIIEGFTLPVWKIQRKIQKIIFDYESTAPNHIKHTHIKAGGRSAAEIIESDPEYLKNIFRMVQPNVEVGDSDTCVNNFLDLDYKIVALSTNYIENLGLRGKLAQWMAYKISQHPKWANIKQVDLLRQVDVHLNRKFCNPNEDGPLGNRFMLISVGDRSLSVDIVIAQNLRRDFLLSPDRIQIPYNIVKVKKEDGTKTITLTHQAFQRKYLNTEKPEIRPSLKLIDLVQTLLDRKAKIVHFPHIETMDFNGWFKLMQYYVEGYRAAEDERVLLNLAAIPGYEMAFAKRLDSFVSAHFQDEASLYFYYLNCLLCLNRHGKTQFSDIIHYARPDWFGKPGMETQQLARMLNCMGLLLLSTETAGEAFNVELTTSSAQPALRWTYKIGKKAYSLLIPFTSNNILKEFIELFKESPQFFTGLVRGRQTKKDLSLVIALLKLSKINDEMLLIFIQSLGNESNRDAALMAQYWLPIAKALKGTLNFTSPAQVVEYLKKYVPTLRRTDFQEQYQSVILDLLKNCLGAKNPVELAANVSLVFELTAANPWIMDGPQGKRFQTECLRQLEECFKSASKLSACADIIRSIEGIHLQRVFAPRLVVFIQDHINGLRSPLHMLRALITVLEWGAAHSWIHDNIVANDIRAKTLLLIEEQFTSSKNLEELRSLLRLVEGWVYQTDIIPLFRNIAKLVLNEPENRQSHCSILIECLESCPWIYENDLSASLVYIESLLKYNSCSQNSAFAQDCLARCFEQDLPKEKVAILFPFVRFSKLSSEVKKKIQGIYQPIIQTHHDAGRFGEIIRLYQWLGISASATPAQVKKVFPAPCCASFQKVAGTFFLSLFSDELKSQKDPKAIYKFLLHVHQWHEECPWIFESQENFNAFETNVFRILHDAVAAQSSQMLVVLKEVMLELLPKHYVHFVDRARALLASGLSSRGEFLIWNLTSIQVCFQQFPWIYANQDQEKRSLIESAIQTLASLTRPDPRVNNLLNTYLCEYFVYPDLGTAVVNLLMGSSINISPTLKESLRSNGKRLAQELARSGHHQVLLNFYMWTYVHAIDWTKDDEIKHDLLRALALSEIETIEKIHKIFFKEEIIEENDEVVELFLKISAKLLAAGKEREVESILSQIQSTLPQSHRACGCLYYDHMTAQKPTRERLQLCRSFALCDSWQFARERDAARSQQYAETLFEAAKDTHFKEISIYDAFRLIQKIEVLQIPRWLNLFEHSGSFKRKQEFETMWKAFCGLPIPQEHAYYLKVWILGLRRAVELGIVAANDIPLHYNRVQTILNQLPISPLHMEINFSLFKLLAHACSNDTPLSADCWLLIKRIVSSYDKMPPSMEVDYIQLYARSLDIKDFMLACKLMYARLPAKSSADILLAVTVMKQVKRFKESAFKEDTLEWDEAMEKVAAIYGQLLDSDVDKDVFDAFIESGNEKLICSVLMTLFLELSFIHNRDGTASFKNYPCPISPSNLLRLFEYIMRTPSLSTGYKRLARRILGHPSTAPLIRDRVTIDHWVKDLSLRATSPEFYSTVEDFSTEVKELVMMAYAPPGFATDPSTVAFYLKMIESIFWQGNPITASEIQALYFLCGLGRVTYENRYRLVGHQWESNNSFLKGTEYLVISPNSPCLKSEQWQRNCLDFQARLVDKLTARLLLHGTLEDDRGEYSRIFINKQVAIILEICQKATFKIPQELKQKLISALKIYYSVVILLPKSRKAEIEFLNIFPLQYGILRGMFKEPKSESHFDDLAAMQSVLASQYSLDEVPCRLCTFDSGAKWNSIYRDITLPYTDIAIPYGHLEYYFKLMLSFLRKNDEPLLPQYVHQLFTRIFIYLEMRPSALNGLTQNPDRSDYPPRTAEENLKNKIKNLKSLELLIREAAANLLKQIDMGEPSASPYDIIEVLWQIMSRWFNLATMYPELPRQICCPTLFGLEIYNLLEPHLIKFGFKKDAPANSKEKFEFISLAMGIIFKEAHVCINQNKIEALEKLSYAFTQVIILRRWNLDAGDRKASDEILKSFILSMGKLLYITKGDEVIEFLRKLFDFGLQNGAFQTFTPEVLQSVENIVTGNYPP